MSAQNNLEKNTANFPSLTEGGRQTGKKTTGNAVVEAYEREFMGGDLTATPAPANPTPTPVVTQEPAAPNPEVRSKPEYRRIKPHVRHSPTAAARKPHSNGGCKQCGKREECHKGAACIYHLRNGCMCCHCNDTVEATAATLRKLFDEDQAHLAAGNKFTKHFCMCGDRKSCEAYYENSVYARKDPNTGLVMWCNKVHERADLLPAFQAVGIPLGPQSGFDPSQGFTQKKAEDELAEARAKADQERTEAIATEAHAKAKQELSEELQAANAELQALREQLRASRAQVTATNDEVTVLKEKLREKPLVVTEFVEVEVPVAVPVVRRRPCNFCPLGNCNMQNPNFEHFSHRQAWPVYY